MRQIHTTIVIMMLSMMTYAEEIYYRPTRDKTELISTVIFKYNDTVISKRKYELESIPKSEMEEVKNEDGTTSYIPTQLSLGFGFPFVCGSGGSGGCSTSTQRIDLNDYKLHISYTNTDKKIKISENFIVDIRKNFKFKSQKNPNLSIEIKIKKL